MTRPTIILTGLLVGLSILGWRLLPERAGRPGAERGPDGKPLPVDCDATPEIQTLRLQVAVLAARLASVQHCEPVPPGPTGEEPQPEPEGAEAEADPPPPRAGASVPREGPPPPDIEAFVRNLARQMDPPFELGPVVCTDATCRIETVDARDTNRDSVALRNFAAHLPDAIVQPDPARGNRETVLFSRDRQPL
jgi:hypothetical protein